MQALTDEGSVGAIAFVGIALVVVGLILIAYGPVVDQLVSASNDLMMSSDLPVSQERVDCISALCGVFHALGVVVPISLGIYLLVVAIRDRSGGI